MKRLNKDFKRILSQLDFPAVIVKVLGSETASNNFSSSPGRLRTAFAHADESARDSTYVFVANFFITATRAMVDPVCV